MTHPNFPEGLDLVLDNDDLDKDGDSIQQDLKYGIAGKIWAVRKRISNPLSHLKASHALDAYLRPPSHIEFDPPCPPELFTDAMNVLELGSGVGYLLLRLGQRIQNSACHLIMTDLADVVPLLQSNLRRVQATTQVAHISVAALEWGNKTDIADIRRLLGDSIDILICSDLTYFPHLFEPLIQTMISIPAQKLIIGYKIRSLVKEEAFWREFGRYFVYEPALFKETGQWKIFGADKGTFIFIATRRSKCLDAGTMDDTFERLLLGGINVGEE